jgi:hypothetical protein
MRKHAGKRIMTIARRGHGFSFISVHQRSSAASHSFCAFRRLAILLLALSLPYARH